MVLHAVHNVQFLVHVNMSSENDLSGREPVDYRVWERVDRILDRRQISLKKISNDLQISYRTLQNYRAHKTNVSVPNLKKICQYLEVEADYFLFGGVDLDRSVLWGAIEKTLSDLLDSMTFKERQLVMSPGQELPEKRQTKAIVIGAEVRDRYILDRDAKRWKEKGGEGYDAVSGVDIVLGNMSSGQYE